MSSPELLRDLDRDTGWTLMVEGAEQSYVDVEDATVRKRDGDDLSREASLVDGGDRTPVRLERVLVESLP